MDGWKDGRKSLGDSILRAPAVLIIIIIKIIIIIIIIIMLP